MLEELRATYLAKEKSELLLSNLEKLKSDVSAVQARYNVLMADYTKICDEAISRLSALKITIEKDLENKLGDLEIFEPGINNLEARFKLGLIPVETYLKEKENVTPPAGPQLAIDKAADGIELGLDRLGDALVFPMEKMARYAGRFRSVNRKKGRRHHT